MFFVKKCINRNVNWCYKITSMWGDYVVNVNVNSPLMSHLQRLLSQLFYFIRNIFLSVFHSFEQSACTRIFQSLRYLLLYLSKSYVWYFKKFPFYVVTLIFICCPQILTLVDASYRCLVNRVRCSDKRTNTFITLITKSSSLEEPLQF